MKRTRIAAFALASALLALPAGAVTVDTEWWNVDFESPTTNGVTLVSGELGSLTNLQNDVAGTKPPYLSGIWTAIEGDESYVTNGVVTNAVDGTSDSSDYLKLDTQGNDLAWAPTNAADHVINLVDADLLLVGSDSAPDASDFDPTNAASRVQTAIYLKNEIDEDTGETTNSILCVYAFDSSLDGGNGGNAWMELTGDVEILDNSWHHIQVSIDYTDSEKIPSVVVNVDGKPMSLVSGGSIMPASPSVAQASGKVNQVCFRGTGAIDNFVGTTQEDIPDYFDFTAEVYMDGTFVPSNSLAANKTTVMTNQEVKTSSTVLFEGFTFDNWTSASVPATWCLTQVDLIDVATSNTTTYTYTYNSSGVATRITADDPDNNPVFFVTRKTGSINRQTGDFTVTVPTAGATNDMVVAKIYFQTIGAHYANAITVVDGDSTTESTLVKPSDFNEGATKPLSWTFPQSNGDYVLRTISSAANVVYANGAVTVTTNLTEALAGNTTFVTATYVEGDYTGKTPQLIDNGDGTYTLGVYVAKLGTTPYETLAGAILAASADSDVTNEVVLLASVAEDVVIPADKNIALDLNGNAITNVASDTISVYGTLILSDSSENTNGVVASAIANKAAIVNYPTGTVVIEAGTIAVPDDATYYNIKNMGRMTIEEGAVVVSRVSTHSTLIANGWYGNAAIDRGTEGQADTAILTINGGTFDGGMNVVKNDDYGILVIEGGSFSNISETDAVILNWHDTTINGGSFTGVTKILCNGSYGANSADKGSLVVTGGTFTQTGTGDSDTLFGYGRQGGQMADALIEISGGTFYGAVNGLGDNGGTYGHIAISGGSFDEIVRASYCAEGYVPVTTQDENGLYTVGKGAVQITIAEVVRTFGSIADAQAAATAAEIADPVFTIIDELSEETVTLAYGDTLKILVAEGGDATALAVETSEAGDAQYAYEVASETDDETGVTTYSVARTVKSYDVIWVVDGADPVTNVVAYGETPAYEGTPTKASTDTTDYAFAGWTPEVAAVTGEATYTATWTESVRTYAITFWDGTEEEGDDPFFATNAPYGDTLYGPAEDPAKEATAQFTYAFAGWTNEVAGGEVVATADLPAVTGAAEWTAVFTEVTKTFDITFMNEDVEFFKTNVAYGTTGYGPAENPTKAADAQFAYAFDCWTNAAGDQFSVDLGVPFPVATTDETYYATYTSTLRSYNVIWVVDGADPETNVVAYGTVPTHADPTKASTDDTVYTFAGWTPEVVAVAGEATYTATWTETARTYAIEFYTNGVVYATTNATWHETGYGPADPAAPDGYAFAGWTNAVAGGEIVAAANLPEVAGEAAWTAVFEEDAQPPEVDVGDNLVAADGAPMAFDPTTGACTVRFRAPAKGVYVLMSSTTVNGTYEPETGASQTVTDETDPENNLVQLTEHSAGTVKFFKIGWEPLP